MFRLLRVRLYVYLDLHNHAKHLCEEKLATYVFGP